jgi:hypothetical protein
MLYQKKTDKKLSDELFQSPTSEYRGTPFWSWNTDLEKDELLWQIDQLKEMGFGGFHIHSRAGMATEYLGKEFMELVKACNDKAKQSAEEQAEYQQYGYQRGGHSLCALAALLCRLLCGGLRLLVFGRRIFRSHGFNPPVTQIYTVSISLFRNVMRHHPRKKVPLCDYLV